MTEQRKLRELSNSIRITGTLKEMNLEIKPAKADKAWKNQVMGNLVILVELDGKLNEHRVEFFAKDTSKLYKGYETVINEYKSIDKHGKENATRLTVTGNVDGNDYMGSDGQLNERNRNRGLFINRVEDETIPDEAVAVIELVVTGLRPLNDKEGIENGRYAIDGFTVGFEGKNVIVLRNLEVGEKLADVITSNYEIGSTGKLTFQMNNYVEVSAKPVDPFAETGGFGVQVEIGDEVKNYTRNLEVIGGFPPYVDERAYEEEDIVFAKKLRALKLQEVKNSTPAVPPRQAGGFGANAAKDPFVNAGPIDISDDDLPF
jgi:hypothetical protein